MAVCGCYFRNNLVNSSETERYEKRENQRKQFHCDLRMTEYKPVTIYYTCSRDWIWGRLFLLTINLQDSTGIIYNCTSFFFFSL